jgi:hypothetical protein
MFGIERSAGHITALGWHAIPALLLDDARFPGMTRVTTGFQIPPSGWAAAVFNRNDVINFS